MGGEKLTDTIATFWSNFGMKHFFFDFGIACVCDEEHDSGHLFKTQSGTCIMKTNLTLLAATLVVALLGTGCNSNKIVVTGTINPTQSFLVKRNLDLIETTKSKAAKPGSFPLVIRAADKLSLKGGSFPQVDHLMVGQKIAGFLREFGHRARYRSANSGVAEETSPPVSLTKELEKLNALKKEGALTDEEFSKAKKRLLEGDLKSGASGKWEQDLILEYDYIPHKDLPHYTLWDLHIRIVDSKSGSTIVDARFDHFSPLSYESILMDDLKVVFDAINEKAKK